MKRLPCLHRMNSPSSRTKEKKRSCTTLSTHFPGQSWRMLGEQTAEVTTEEGKVSSWESQSYAVSHDANTLTEGPRASCSCSSEAWPVPKLSHFLASFYSWAISWAAVDSSLHSCGLASLQQEPQRPKCPLGLSPESKVLPVSTTAFTH